MAKFVIAGKSNCPYYAKAELLGDALVKNLPNFEIYKKVVDPKEWNDWLERVCKDHDWKHVKSPIIWRELVYRGGKPMLLGDANDFQEYVRNYYDYLGPVGQLTSADLRKISAENEDTHELDEAEKRAVESNIKPLILTITNPTSPVTYHFVNEILSGDVFGAERDLEIRLYCNPKKPETVNALKGMKMEIEDLASKNLRRVRIATNEQEAFENSDFVILLDELDECVEASDSKSNNGESASKVFTNPYVTLAHEIDKNVKSTCKILVSPFGLRQETYLITNSFGKELRRIDAHKQVIGNSIFDEMSVKAVLGARLNVDPAYIRNVIFVGQNLDASFYVDLTQGEVTNYDGAVWAKTNSYWRNLVHLVADRNWIKQEFIDLIHERETKIKEKLKREPYLMFAQSIATLCRLWSTDNSDDTAVYSAIVNSNKHFLIDEEVYLSVPVRFKNGAFQIATDLRLQPYVEDMVKDTLERMEKRFLGDKIVESNKFKPSFNRVKYE